MVDNRLLITDPTQGLLSRGSQVRILPGAPPYPFPSSHLAPEGIVTCLIHKHLLAHPFRSVPKDSQIERGIIVGELGRRHGTIGRREGALAADTGPLR